MKRILSQIKSSFHDIRCCDENKTTVVDGVTVAWRALASSLSCVLNGSGKKTGYVTVGKLEQYNTVTGLATGISKDNSAGDANYIANYLDTNTCSLDPDVPQSVNAALSNHSQLYGIVIITDTLGQPHNYLYRPNQYRSLGAYPVGQKHIYIRTDETLEIQGGKPARLLINGDEYFTEGEFNLDIVAPIVTIDIYPFE